jgi:DNA-directed RNA polymerase alpha subunit
MTAPVPVQDMTLLLPVGDLWLGKRTHCQTLAYGCLRRAGIERTGQLTDWDAVSLLKLRAFGPGCLAEVEKALRARGLNLKSAGDGSERP